jgi:hypothetical protein
MRLRTGNKRRKRAGRYDPICCPRHGIPLRGDGWEVPDKVGRFKCYAPGCKTARLWHAPEVSA